MSVMMKTMMFPTTALPWKLAGESATTSRQSQPILAIARSQPFPSLQHPQITHSMPQEKVELFKSLEPWVSEQILPLLKPVEKSWQPSEFLPDPTKPKNDFIDEFLALQKRTLELPDEYIVVLAGNMIVEDAIPTYQAVLNTLDGVKDETAASPTPWATWIRGWSAEESRHGDVLRTYLYFSGRIDMLMIEKTLQHLIRAGMDVGLENNPYLGFTYFAFQERATFVNHSNIGRLIKESGDPLLATICGAIAADEKRHENAYARMIEKLLEIDVNETMLAIGKMMRKEIRMPGYLMYDGRDAHLYEHYTSVVQCLGVYTVSDYINILEFFIERWGLEKLEGLKGDGRNEQEFVCGLPNIMRKLLERDEKGNNNVEEHKQKFSWIFDKELTI